MAKMNWNRPNNGYEKEPWQKAWEPKKEKPKVILKPSWAHSYDTAKVNSKKPFIGQPKMTDEARTKIQALRKK